MRQLAKILSMTLDFTWLGDGLSLEWHDTCRYVGMIGDEELYRCR